MLCNDRLRLRGTVALVVAALSTTIAIDVNAATYSNIVSFGDSLIDTGNIYAVTSRPEIQLAMGVFFPEINPPIPQEPHFERRFSNGFVWIDHLNEGLGLGPAIPSESGGFNYAIGGATAGGGSPVNAFFPLDIPDQVSDYLSSRNPTGSELFVVQGGVNDLLTGCLLCALTGEQTDVTIPTMSLVESLGRLYDAGGRHFLVPNLPPLGKIPRLIGTLDEPVLDARTVAFNDHLSSLLDQIEATRADITIHRVDFYGTMQQILADPSQFGFTNLTDAAYDEVSGAVVSNVDAYLFWDTIHPTARAHEIIGSMAVATLISEPSTLVLPVLALLGLFGFARRGQRAPRE